MHSIFRSAQRGAAEHGWLSARHSFSFANWYEPSRMGFGVLRVINEDRVAPHSGFGTHGHRDMEILTYLLEGALWHKDSMGNGDPEALRAAGATAGAAGASGGPQQGVIRPGEIQRMSAGNGVMHSEFNHGDEPTHLLQIWLLPQQRGGAPGYEQASVPPDSLDGRLALLAAPDAERARVTIHSDVRLYAGRFDGAQSAALDLPPGRLAYVHVARGSVQVNGTALQAGDAWQAEPAPGEALRVELTQGQQAELLLFDLGR